MANSQYYVVDGWGDSIDSPNVEEMQKFLDKLDIDDPEHCEVWLSHWESGWTLGCLPNNEVHLDIDADNGQNIPPRHLTNVSREKMLSLWQKLANGQLEELEKEPWLPGYTSEPPPPKPDPKEIHRSFWNDLVTAERIPNAKCKIEECNENPIALTIFCPKHFFEKCTKIPCPFD
jgi:hypothetical protein